jgi:multisubunit Na+/H+ antiporter MnhE subunit
MKAAARFAAWTVAFFGVWLLLVGTNAGLEEIAGACAAVVAATFQAVFRRRSERRIALTARDALRFRLVPFRLVRDFAIVIAALFLPASRRGAFRDVATEIGGDSPASRGRRALFALLGSLAPNTYVVEFDREGKRALLHDLDPRRADVEPL